MSAWSLADMPPQTGRLAVVTGTGGLGLECALALARAGATVVVAGRNRQKGDEALQRITRDLPGALVRFEVLDLASLASIDAFAARLTTQLAATGARIDLLINNAAVMAPPKRQVTSDGFELQLGTNHLGHFALTGRLLPLLRTSGGTANGSGGANGARVVTVSSVAARDGAIDFDDLQAERGYQPMGVYGRSKLANLMFALELQRRSDAGGWGIESIAAHPGLARTDLIPNGIGRNTPAGVARVLLGPIFFQAASQGALPTLFSATSPEARGGGYYGPRRLGETRGPPAAAKVPAQALDAAVAARLWDTSQALTKAPFATARSPNRA